MSCGHALPEPLQCAAQTKHDPSLSLGTEHAMHERTTHPSTGMDRKTRSSSEQLCQIMLAFWSPSCVEPDALGSTRNQMLPVATKRDYKCPMSSNVGTSRQDLNLIQAEPEIPRSVASNNAKSV